MTPPDALQQVDRTFVYFRRRKLSYFSGCDYFRLASHPSILRAAGRGLTKWGLNVAASRLTTGNHKLYEMLEGELADFFKAEDALLLPAGYLSSLAVAQALAGQFSHAVIDEQAHPALWDATLLLDCPVLKFRHCDVGNFSRTLQRCGRASRPIVLTDGMFAQDGCVAPLKLYLDFLPADGLLLVDDAHGAGVLGKTGQGSLEAEGVRRRRIIQCITLSKAFGVYGGAVLGTRELRDRILTHSRLFIGSTPLPLPLASAALESVNILKNSLPLAGTETNEIVKRALVGDRNLRRRLFRNTNHVKMALRNAGMNLPESAGPILPLHLSNQRDIDKLKRRLLEAGIYPPFLKYPGVPAIGCFRFVISSEHSRAQLNNLIKVLTRPL